MPTLDPTLRDLLATVIGKEKSDNGARILAEAGAKAAIEALAVHLAAPHAHLDTAQKQLRNRLRARARQLGDTRHPDGRHDIGRLVEQAAYEHWHRMLFARFLAENDLLIHPEMKVAVTLEECAELAASEGAADGWELAGRYASRMLPQIFRPDDALLAVRFAIDDVKKLETLLDSLPAALFTASDSLGWCYQFWQARRKKEVNDSEVKIGADELPAVTQLFTEPYMVQFLLHNTLGAWWVGAGRALPVEMPYLRFLDDGTTAAGTFEGWPRLARELKVLDPCCGSGHFLVAAFEILVAFRVAEEGLTAREACDAVFRDNLFGLEIDARCVQIAAFALAMAAWTYPEAGGYRPLAPMNVACSGLAISAKKEEWERLGGDNARLRAGMGRMWELFSDAPVLGSLIDPRKDIPNPMFTAGFDELNSLLDRALSVTDAEDLESFENSVSAQGTSLAGAVLSARYHLVVTNVPYLGRGKQEATLRKYSQSNFPGCEQDLATTCIARCVELVALGGTTALVTPQNWTCLATYKHCRERVLAAAPPSLIVDLPAGAFRTSLYDFSFVLWIGTAAKHTDPIGYKAILADPSRDLTTRANSLRESHLIPHAGRLSQFSMQVSLKSIPPGVCLSEVATVFCGLQTGDNNRFVRNFWEVPRVGGGWEFLQRTSDTSQHWGGLEQILWWENGEGTLSREDGFYDRGTKNIRDTFGKVGVGFVSHRMGKLPVCRLVGNLIDQNGSPIIPIHHSDAAALWCFLTSPEYHDGVRTLDAKVGVTPGTLARAPIDIEKWRAVARERYPDGLPSPDSPDPDQWIFTGAPRNSIAPLHVAVARHLGYRWPDQQPDALDAHADQDGIVCIPALRGERPAADRLADLLATAWGKDWHPQTLTDLLAAVGHHGTLEEWLRDAFFKQHCELFHNRPFVWHVWDGHREGFSALVSYHKLDHEGLKSLTYSYLGDWIRTQEIEAKAGKSGAGDKLAKAKALQQRLAAILEGEVPLDIFVRWKPIEHQPIGWFPDLDDGVRLNIRPFLTVADVGAKGAGVLRWKPNIKWGKDRGKNPPGSPWGEDRDNDTHLTLAEKRAARGET